MNRISVICSKYFCPTNKPRVFHVRGDRRMTSTLRGMGGETVRQEWADVIGRRGWGLVSVLDLQSLFSFIRENWICAMTRHHAEPNINISLTKKFPFDYDVRQWFHPLMIPLHCLWAKSNNRTRGQYSLQLTDTLKGGHLWLADNFFFSDRILVKIS